MPTYYDRIMSILGTTPMTFEEILHELQLPTYKTIHVISGIKKGIQTRTIEKIENPSAETLFVGHSYRKLI